MVRSFSELEGKEVVLFTTATDDAGDRAGHYMGTVRRVSDGAVELRRNDGHLVYIAFAHIVRFHEAR